MPSITASLFPDACQPHAAVPQLAEVLIEHRDLARLGWLDEAQTLGAAQQAHDMGHRAVLVWDTLVDDRELANRAAIVRALGPDKFDAVRVTDPGVARYVRQQWPHWPLQLGLETGNHNRVGILAWAAELAPERLILSNELPLDLIRDIRQQLQTPIEMLALGRLLIFYTPRKLIDPFSHEHVPATIRQRFITSEEDRKHFPLVENRHGTFMFYEKDLFLLPYLAEMDAAGVDWVRLELKFYQRTHLTAPLHAYLAGDTNALANLKAQLAPRLTRGFFKSNRTDKQFERLKNFHLTPPDSAEHVATVLESRKKHYVALQTHGPIQCGESLRFVIPEGESLQHTITWLRNAAGDAFPVANSPGLWLINHGRRLSPGTKVFRDGQ